MPSATNPDAYCSLRSENIQPCIESEQLTKDATSEDTSEMTTAAAPWASSLSENISRKIGIAMHAVMTPVSYLQNDRFPFVWHSANNIGFYEYQFSYPHCKIEQGKNEPSYATKYCVPIQYNRSP